MTRAPAPQADITDNQPSTDPAPASSKSRLRAADPSRRDRGEAMAAGTVFMVMIAVLGLAAAFNAETMLHRAETSELGFRRDAALAFWRPVAEATAPLGFGLPRAGIEALRDVDPQRDDGTSIVAGPDTSAAGSQPGRDRLGHEPAGPRIALGTTTAPTEGSSGATATLTTRQSDPVRRTSGEVLLGPRLPPSSPADGLPSQGSSSSGRGSGSGDQPGTSDLPGTWLRQPSAEDPLRLLIIGDSTMDAVGASILRDLTSTGVASGELDFRISTGLSRPDFFDWPAHLRELQAAQATEIVVIMIGANDAQPFLIDEVPENYGTERWFDTYRQRVAALLDEVTAAGSHVIWIGQPAMRNHEFDLKMQQLDEIYIEEIARYPSAHYIDSRTAMTDEGGGYSDYLPDPSGNQVLVRQTDGIHLTTAGGDRLSPLIIDVIDRIAPLPAN